MNKKPKGIYLVAIVFFVGSLICMAELLNVVFALGVEEGLNLATVKWVVTGYMLALCVVCYGVVLLTRLHPAPQWLMFGMTLFLTVQLAAAPAGDSPIYSEPRIYLNAFCWCFP